MLRQCTDADVTAVCAIINDAAQAYRGVIPSECWRDPYMSRAALAAEIAADVSFSASASAGELIGVMGCQHVGEVTLIRHAYVDPRSQGRGISGALLDAFCAQKEGLLLVGTWAAADWAIRFTNDINFGSLRETTAIGCCRHVGTFQTASERLRRARPRKRGEGSLEARRAMQCQRRGCRLAGRPRRRSRDGGGRCRRSQSSAPGVMTKASISASAA